MASYRVGNQGEQRYIPSTAYFYSGESVDTPVSKTWPWPNRCTLKTCGQYIDSPHRQKVFGALAEVLRKAETALQTRAEVPQTDLEALRRLQSDCKTLALPGGFVPWNRQKLLKDQSAMGDFEKTLLSDTGTAYVVHLTDLTEGEAARLRKTIQTGGRAVREAIEDPNLAISHSDIKEGFLPETMFASLQLTIVSLYTDYFADPSREIKAPPSIFPEVSMPTKLLSIVKDPAAIQSLKMAITHHSHGPQAEEINPTVLPIAEELSAWAQRIMATQRQDCTRVLQFIQKMVSEKEQPRH